MRLIRGTSHWQETYADLLKGGCVATLGNFDGVHLGHKAIFSQLTQEAKKRQLPSCVISFEPLPHEYFAPEANIGRLHGLRDRYNSIAQCGVDILLLITFNADFAAQKAQTFITNTLVKTLRISHLIVGDDVHFGHNREGNFALLQQHGAQYGFSVEQTQTIIDTALHNGAKQRISSSRIRQHLAQGDMAQAACLLGRRYHISGRIVQGEKMGRKLGFPTANISLKQQRPPLKGVFAVVAHHLETGKAYAAVANLGERPTLGGRKRLLEVHILDHGMNLYGGHLQVEFVEFLRGEQRFDSLDALKNAIFNDAEQARLLLNSNPEFTYLANRIN